MIPLLTINGAIQIINGKLLKLVKTFLQHRISIFKKKGNANQRNRDGN